MKLRFPETASKVMVVIIGCLAYALVYFHRNSTSVLINQLAEKLNVSKDRINIFSSMYLWTYAILQPIGGLLADIISPGKLLFFVITLASIGSMIIAFSTKFWLSSIARCLIGLGCAPVYVPIVRLLANWFTPRSFSIFNALVMSAGSVGGLLSQGPLATLVKHVDWTYTYIGASVLGFLIGLFSLIFIKPRPEEKEREEHVSKENEQTEHGEKLSPLKQLWKNLKSVMTNKEFHKMVCWSSTSAPTYFVCTAYWCVPYLTSVFNFATEHAGYVVLMLSIASIVGSPLIAGLSELVHSRKYVVMCGSILACLSCIIFMFLTGSTPEFVVWLLLFVYGISTSGVIGVAVATYKEISTPEATATITGCANFYPFFASTLLQLLIGKLLQVIDGESVSTYSSKAFKYGMWLPNAIFTGISIIPLIFVKETFKIQGDFYGELVDSKLSHDINESDESA